MVEDRLIYRAFTQNSNSCILASYGVVAKYYRPSIDLHEIFNQYCDHFRVPFRSTLDSERSSSNHLNLYCQKVLGWAGYQMIDYLHNCTFNNLFWINRSFFTTQIFSLTPLTPFDKERLIKHLQEHESLANFTTAEKDGFHSRTIGVEHENRIFIQDTALNGDSNLWYLTEDQLPLIQECILYNRK